MSSGFVTEGTYVPPTQPTAKFTTASNDADSAPQPASPEPEPDALDSWAAADAAVAAAKAKAAASHGLMGSQADGKTLFDVLEANKARKQEEIEEKLKFKNQFRTLDDDEIDFLDSIVATEREAEIARKKEIESQLDVFRKQQYEADHDGSAVADQAVEDVNSTWAVNARKRRKKEKEKEKGVGGIKLRKLSESGKKSNVEEDVKAAGEVSKASTSGQAPKPASSKVAEPLLKASAVSPKAPAASPPVAKVGLGGLVAGYGSDSDDD